MAATKEQWLEQRMLWEANPTYLAKDVAAALGVSEAAVSQRIKKQEWKRVGSQTEIARRAYDKADQEAAEEARREAKEKAQKLIAEGKAEEARKEQVRVEQTTELAVDMKASILNRHRKELDGSRNIIYEAIRNKDFEKAKLGKITAEALCIVQNGERKAWGFDSEEKNPTAGEVRVVIERRELSGVGR